MRSERKEIDCLLCGRKGTGSTEDVIGKWVRRVFDVQGRVTLKFSDEGSLRSSLQQRILKVTLEDMVCVRCNNEWMSRLEQKAQTVLTDMMLNRARRTLSRSDQSVVAAWAFKTVSLLEYAIEAWHGERRKQAGYRASAAELAWLFTYRQPPPRSRVWLGAFDAQNEVLLNQGTTNMQVSKGPEGEAKSLVAHLTLVTLGYVALQVFSIDYLAAEAGGFEEFAVAPPANLSPVLTPIWPTIYDQVQWPAAQYIGRDQFSLVRTWAGRFAN
jgi:hypothetical protein